MFRYALALTGLSGRTTCNYKSQFKHKDNNNFRKQKYERLKIKIRRAIKFYCGNYIRDFTESERYLFISRSYQRGSVRE